MLQEVSHNNICGHYVYHYKHRGKKETEGLRLAYLENEVKLEFI